MNDRETTTSFAPDFTKTGDGLMPVIVQDARTKDVLMLGFANKEALQLMFKEGKAAFWSRSRQTFWIKGETSGNFMVIKEMWIDCDQDTLLLLVEPQGDGRACHVNGPDGKRRSCFFRRVEMGTDIASCSLVIENP